MMVRLIRRKFFTRDLDGEMSSTAVTDSFGDSMGGSTSQMVTVAGRSVQPGQGKNSIWVALICASGRTLVNSSRPRESRSTDGTAMTGGTG